LFASSDAVTLHDSTSPVSDVHRLGYGYLDILAAENAAGEWGRARLPMAQTESDGIDEESGDEPGEQPTEESVEVDESLLKAVSALLSANGQQQVMSFALSLLDEEVSEDARTSSTDTPPSLLGLYPGYIEAPYEQEE
jgi:hypothetical protein